MAMAQPESGEVVVQPEAGEVVVVIAPMAVEHPDVVFGTLS